MVPPPKKVHKIVSRVYGSDSIQDSNEFLKLNFSNDFSIAL